VIWYYSSKKRITDWCAFYSQQINSSRLMSRRMVFSFQLWLSKIREAHSSEIFSITVTSTRAITASGDSSIKVWDAKSQGHPLIHTFVNAHHLGAHHVVVDVDAGGSMAASSGFGQELAVWDLLEGKEKARLDPAGYCFPILTDFRVK
jgi:WD40 repeat protein